MDTYSKFQSGVVLLSALLGVIVTFWPPDSFKIKLAIVFIFAVLGLTAIFLQQQKEKGDKASAEHIQAELLNWQRGDPKNPPRFGFTQSVNPADGALTIRFHMENDGDYPAYDISGRLWDLDRPLPSPPVSLEGILMQDLVTVNIPSLSGHIIQMLNTITVPSTQTSKRFGAQYTTRTGGFAEKIRAERVDGKWAFATQVTHVDESSEVMFERIDPDFPRDKSGQVDWSM
jgi:hypothetical protein